jgi:hypothetical protein
MLRESGFVQSKPGHARRPGAQGYAQCVHRRGLPECSEFDPRSAAWVAPPPVEGGSLRLSVRVLAEVPEFDPGAFATCGWGGCPEHFEQVPRLSAAASTPGWALSSIPSAATIVDPRRLWTLPRPTFAHALGRARSRHSPPEQLQGRPVSCMQRDDIAAKKALVRILSYVDNVETPKVASSCCCDSRGKMSALKSGREWRDPASLGARGAKQARSVRTSRHRPRVEWVGNSEDVRFLGTRKEPG